MIFVSKWSQFAIYVTIFLYIWQIYVCTSYRKEDTIWRYLCVLFHPVWGIEVLDISMPWCDFAFFSQFIHAQHDTSLSFLVSLFSQFSGLNALSSTNFDCILVAVKKKTSFCKIAAATTSIEEKPFRGRRQSLRLYRCSA